MARSFIGGTTSDWVFATGAAGAVKVTGGELKWWTQESGGTQITDLQLNGATVSSIPVPADGQIPRHSWPSGVMWAWGSVNGGPRVLTLAQEAMATKSRTPARADTRKLLGPVHPDVTTCLTGQEPAAGYTTTYDVGAGSTPAAGYPVGFTHGDVFANAGYINRLWPQAYSTWSGRFTFDGDNLAVLYYGAASSAMQVFVDGVPAHTGVLNATHANKFLVLKFSTARPRSIEIRTSASLGSIYCVKPYTCTRAARPAGPLVGVIGDSYAMPSIYDSTAAVYAQIGAYQQIGPHVGVEEVLIDGIGGSGYGVAGLGTSYQDRLAAMCARKPDVLWIHGGGANDLNQGRTVGQVVGDAVALFTRARDLLPSMSKLVFMEGFAPPVFTPATFNPNYAAVSAQLRTALAGVGVYYVDVATTAPWITGTGNQASPTGAGNSDVYIGSDGVHPTVAGYRYLAHRIGERMRTITDDDGTLLNQLV